MRGPVPLARTVALVRRQTRLLQMMAWTWGVVSSADVLERWSSDVDALRDRFKMRWVRGAVRICGLDLRVVRGAPPNELRDRARLVVANHRTPLDIVALLSLFGGHFLANHRVSRAPVIGPGAHKIGTVFVDREDRKSGVAAIRTMRRLLEQRRTMIVFPEGTTFGGDEVRPFKGGAFTAAGSLPVDVVPVGIAYTPGHEFARGSMGDHIRGFLGRARTPAWVSIGEPIAIPEDRKGFDELVRARVQELVDASRQACREAIGEDAHARLALAAGGSDEGASEPAQRREQESREGA